MIKKILQELSKLLEKDVSAEEFVLYKEILSEIRTDQEIPQFPIINSLQINNISTFNGNPEFQFDNGVTAFYGGTGAGKTTILNSTLFAFLGKTDYFEFAYFDRRRRGENFSASVTVPINTEIYKIYREITGDKHVPKIFRYRKKGQKTLDGKNSTWVLLSEIKTVHDIENKMNNYFHCDIKLLKIIYDLIYLRDNIEISNYIIINELNRNYKKELTLKFLGFNTLNKILISIKSQINHCETVIRRLNFQLKLTEGRLKTIENIDDKVILEQIQVKEKTIRNLEEKKERCEIRNRDLFKEFREEYESLAHDPMRSERALLLNEMDGLKKIVAKDSNFRTILDAKKTYQCSVCNRNYTRIAINRLNDNLCPGCGVLIENSKVITETKQRIRDLDVKFKEVDVKVKEQDEKRQGVIREIDQNRTDLNRIKGKIKSYERDISLMKTKIEQKNIKIDLNELENLEINIEKEEEKLKNFQNLYGKVNLFIINNDKFKDFLIQLNENFAHLQKVTFTKHFGDFDNDFRYFPVITRFIDLSNGQQRFLDILFRIAYMRTLVELEIIPRGFLILDTPEVKIDEYLCSELANVINASTDYISFVITVMKPEFLNELKCGKSYDVNEFSREIPEKRKKFLQKKLKEFNSRDQ